MKRLPDLAIIRTWPKRVAVGYYHYNGDIKYLAFEKEHKKVWSLSENFMYGVNNSISKYIIRIDEDDAITNLEMGIWILNHYLEYSAVSPEKYFLICDDDKLKLGETTLPQGAGIIYCRASFIALGGYCEDVDIQVDLDFYIKFLEAGFKMGKYPGIYTWFIDKHSRSLNKEKMLSEREKILKKWGYKDNEVHHFGAYHYL